MAVNIELVENDGKHWIDVSVGGQTTQYGPYSDLDAAITTANKFNAISRAFYWGDEVAPPPRATLRKTVGGSRRG